MYFLSLEVENIRCFGEKQTLDLSDSDGRPAPWTLLLGDNGVGKTTLLQCLTWMRTVEEPDKKKMPKCDGVILKPMMDDLDESTEMEALIRAGPNMESSVRGKYSLDSSIQDRGKKRRKAIQSIEVGMSFKKRQGTLEDVDPIMDCLRTFRTPNLFAYSASRHMAVRNIDNAELRDPVANLLSESADLYDAEQVLLDLDYQARIEESGPAEPLLNKVRQLLVDLLPDLEDSDAIEILGPKGLADDGEPRGVRIRTPYGSVSLSALSLGYKTMLAWAVDLALRLLRSNPRSPAPLEEPAIVIVDEIDLHLHPKWQREVRIFLCKHFPNVQFICTAHSPFMAQDAEQENLAVLMRDGDHVTIENDPCIVQGWRIDQIATSELVGVTSARSRDVEELINERRGILRKKRKSRSDKMRLAELDLKISALPTEENPENQAAMDLIHKAAELIRKKSA